MRITRLSTKVFSCLLILCGAIATAQADDQKPILAIQSWQTSQGTPVYFVAAPELPMLDVQVIFTAGSAYDEANFGLAEFVTSTLEEGTSEHNADQIATAFDQSGAQFAASTNRDVSIVALRSLSDAKYLTPALQTFSEVLSQANFPDDAVARVKQQTLSAISQGLQDPSTVASNAFYAALYATHPYGHPVLGNANTIGAIDKAQLQRFYQRYFVASNAKIILVGNLSRTQAETIANQLMAKLPKGETAPALTMADSAAQHSTQNITFPAQQTTLILGQLGITPENPQYFPLIVGNYLLGQLPLGSILFEQVRNQRGLVYGVSSNFQLLNYRGPFAVVLKTRTAKKDQALKITQQTLQQFITQGPTEAQLQLAKQNIINSFPLTLATNEDIADTLTQMAIHQRPLNYLDLFRDNINAVTAAQVKQAFSELIHPDKMTIVAVGQ